MNRTTIGHWVNCKMSGINTTNIILYIQVNHHAGTPKHNNCYKRPDKLGYSSICYIGSRIGRVSMKEVYKLKIQSMSRFTGLQFTGLPCLPVCFFRATPSPLFTGGMPVYRGGSFFMLAEPLLLLHTPTHAAAHSHTRCCTLPHTLLHTTQHNTLGVAGSSQHLPTHHAMCGRRIMPT